MASGYRNEPLTTAGFSTAATDSDLHGDLTGTGASCSALCFKVDGAFRQHDRQTLANGIDAFVGESEDDDAGLVEYAEGQNVTNVRSNVMMMLVCASSLDKFSVRRALKPETSHVRRLVAELLQELDGLGRDSSVCQKPHASRAEGVHFVLSEGRGVDERLTDVFLFEVG
jgi:hypothetical protein